MYATCYIEQTDNGYIVRVNYSGPEMHESETRVYNKLTDVFRYIKEVLEPAEQA